MTEIITYSFEQIDKWYKNCTTKIEDIETLQLFNNIRLNNKFNPRFTKKFNYTNWKNSISKEEEQKKNEDDITLEKIRSILNKLTLKTLDNLKDKIVEYIAENTDLLNKTISYMFEMAVIQRIYCNIYAKLCVYLNNIYGETTIKQSLLAMCKKSFSEQFKILDVNEQEDYDSFCAAMKEKKKFIGIFDLVGNLYQENLVENNTIWNYFRLLFKNLESGLDEDTREKYSECLKNLTLKVGKKYKTENIERFTKIIENIKEYSNSDKFKYREKFMFIDVIEMNEKEWSTAPKYKCPRK